MYFELNPRQVPKVRLMNTAVIQPPFVHNKRKADEYIIYVIKKGEMYLKENNREYLLQAGDFLLLDTDYFHEGYKTSYCEYYYIHFRQEEIKKVADTREEEYMKLILSRHNDSLKSDPFSYDTIEKDTLLLPKYYHFNSTADFIKVGCLLDEAIKHNKNHMDNYKIMCSLKVLEAFIETYRSYLMDTLQKSTSVMPKSYHKVQKLLEYLNTEYARKITSSDIEEVSGSNFDYINRIFKKMTHQTIFAYLNTVRINHATELITTTNMKMSEVGQSVGFIDLYYFSKVFKKAVGVSPANYNRSIAGSSLELPPVTR